MDVRQLPVKNMIKKDLASFEIRAMFAVDLEQVLEIETICGLGEWSRADFEKELLDATAMLFVAVEGKEVIGFISARLITSIIEILSIGVSPESRQQGIGSALLQKAMQQASEKGLVESWLEVRESNQTARNFYLARGYKVVGYRPNYYSNPDENAVLMTFIFSDSYPKK